jgi:hypothetical protein
MARLPIIESIFNYCTRRCELCPFTERCSVYLANREHEERRPDETWADQVRDSFAETVTLIETWCKREGVDFAQLRREADSKETTAELIRAEEAVRAAPLCKLATAYMHAALDVIERLTAAGVLRSWPADVSGAIRTISWHATPVGSKTFRALAGCASRNSSDDGEPVQSDWNGSAKVARILVRESRQAWEVIIAAGDAPADSPIRELTALLDCVDAGLAERFPRAEELMRPGFDVPAPEKASAARRPGGW